MPRSKKKKRKKTATPKEIKKKLLRFTKVAFIAVGSVILLRAFVLDVDFASDDSMRPAIEKKDMVMIKKWDIHFPTKGSGIHYDDVVKLSNVESANGEKVNTLKRVIGLPGDSIKIVNGTIYRNNEAIEDLYASNVDAGVNIESDVKEGHIFVLGDNRSDSWDSADFGSLPIDKVIGVVLFESKY